MFSRRPLLLATLWLSLLAAACGGGFDTEEATAACERLRQGPDTCFGAEGKFQECVQCHEECGRECSLVDGTPCSFTCD